MVLANFTCEGCGKYIAIDMYNDEGCPFCGYENPHKRKYEAKCSICGEIALKDKYGNGKCKYCGWEFSSDEVEFEKAYGISYPMLVSPTTAREQYKKGLPFKATFEEFIKGLDFYGEMTFEHNNIEYAVYFDNKLLVLNSKFADQRYKTKKDFINKAHINGKLLKNIWDEVAFAGFM